MKKKKVLHVISGTHWDREWRHTAEQSKLRLVDLMDKIIDTLESNPAYRYFCVDGGMIVLEDYLSIRPENEDRIKKLIKEGRMSVVGWYTLPETNTVAPEALIRNLLLGHRMAKDFGGNMKSGYTATSYGQHSQMPQLYKGFGIETAIFYRGTNKHVLTPLFIWEGADGSTLNTLRTFDEVTRTNWFFYIHGPAVLGKGIKDLSYTYNKDEHPAHMADTKSYEKAFVLLKEEPDFSKDDKVLSDALNNLLSQASPYRIGSHILALNMEDNDEPYCKLPELIAQLNKLTDDVEIQQNTLDNYMDTIINDSGKGELAVHKGELRYTTMEHGNFNALLGATHSSRIKIKIYNENVENNLINLAEPLASFAKVYGKEYPAANLNRAWQALLKNHAHDSICGAAVDRAHEDMLYNFSIAQTVAEEVTNRSSLHLFSKINTAEVFDKDDNTLVLFNTLPYARKELVELVVDTPRGGSGKKDIGVDGGPSGEGFYDIVDRQSNVIPSHQISCDNANVGVERELDTKAVRFSTKRRRILIEAEMPALGYATYALRFRKPNYVYHPVAGPDRCLIARDNGVLENEFLKVELNANGSFSLTEKSSGRTMKNLHYFTDRGETGSAHISTGPERNPVFTSHGCFAALTLEENSQFRGIFKIEMSLNIPAACTLDGLERLKELKELHIVSYLTLEKGSRALKIRTIVDNKCRDHKLCVHFPSGIYAEKAASESAWDVAERGINWAEHGDNFEPFQSCQPMQNFVDISDGVNGFALLNKGLREYEIQDDAERTVNLTLIRTQRAYMTANSEMLTGELEKHTGQHCIGKTEYEYALYPHSGDWRQGKVLAEAYSFKVPVKAVQGVTGALGNLPASASFLRITPEDKIMLSAVKLAENGRDLIVRVWNTTGESVKTQFEFLFAPLSAERVRLDENFPEAVNIDGNKFEYTLGGHKIETFRIKT